MDVDHLWIEREARKRPFMEHDPAALSGGQVVRGGSHDLDEILASDRLDLKPEHLQLWRLGARF